MAGKKNIANRFADVLNILVSAGTLSRKAARLMHKHDHLIFSYANPQAGRENPRPFRVNYGIKLWKHNYDSSMTYEYQSAWGTSWNDFDQHNKYRDMIFAYPTSSGVIDTIAWEGYAQGYRDVKYASKLWQLVNKYDQSSNNAKQKIADDAKTYINNLKIGMDTNLNKVRSKIIHYILKLSE